MICLRLFSNADFGRGRKVRGARCTRKVFGPKVDRRAISGRLQRVGGTAMRTVIVQMRDHKRVDRMMAK